MTSPTVGLAPHDWPRCTPATKGALVADAVLHVDLKVNCRGLLQKGWRHSGPSKWWYSKWHTTVWYIRRPFEMWGTCRGGSWSLSNFSDHVDHTHTIWSLIMISGICDVIIISHHNFRDLYSSQIPLQFTFILMRHVNLITFVNLINPNKLDWLTYLFVNLITSGIRNFVPWGNMKKLLAAKTAFGIIPGGSEDVAIHEYGKENVYINSRLGFIKYALQHGYSLILAYTFGENDQFYSLSCLRFLNLWLVKRFLVEIYADFLVCAHGDRAEKRLIKICRHFRCPKRWLSFYVVLVSPICWDSELGDSAVALLFEKHNPCQHQTVSQTTSWHPIGFGFVLPIFWGKTFFPLLPRGGGLNTVYGRVIHLPVIQDPTCEDLVKWHAHYVDELKSMFDEYKGKFGFGDRELHCFWTRETWDWIIRSSRRILQLLASKKKTKKLWRWENTTCMR